MKRPRIAFCFLALAMMFFWRLLLVPDGFLYRPNSLYSDLTITHWPNAWFIRDSLARWGQVPLWRPLILGGEPFAANPLSGLWYPPNLLLLVLPLTFAFNLLFVLHMAWTGIGGYVLARATGASRAGGVLAALTLMFAPKAIAHLTAGHVGLYYAWAWLPWALWAARRLAERNTLGDIATAAVCAAMLILADVRLGFYGGLAAGVYWVVLVIGDWGVGIRRTGSMPEPQSLIANHLLTGAGAAILAGVLVAVQMLPLAAVAGRLNRGGLTLEESGIASLPPRYLLGLLVADHGGFQEWMTYVGVVGLALAMVGLWRWGDQERWWWGGLAVMAGVYSLGVNTPLYGLLYRILPPLGWLRGPARAWFLVLTAMAVLAARGLTTLEETRFLIKTGFLRRRWPDMAAVGLAGAALAGGLGGLILGLPANAVVAAVVWPLAGMLLLLRTGGRLGRALFAGLALALTLADLWIVGFTLYRVRPQEEVLAEGQEAAEWLAAQPRPFRVYSPSYSIPQHTGAVYGIETVDGVDPFQLADYAAFMRRATGVDIPGYSVTIPAFPEMPAGEDMLQAHRGVIPDLRLLGLLNVRYLAAAYPLEVDGLTPLGVYGGVYLYRNEYAMPRVFMQEGSGAGEEGNGETRESGEARIVEWTPNRIVVESEGPGLLVLSEVYDPDWRVEVDGQESQIEPYQVVRSVHLPEGVHRVVLTYWPRGLSAGIGLMAAGWACVAALWFIGRRRGDGACFVGEAHSDFCVRRDRKRNNGGGTSLATGRNSQDMAFGL